MCDMNLGSTCMWGAQGASLACGPAAQATLQASEAAKATSSYRTFDQGAAQAAPPGRQFYTDLDQYVLDCGTKPAATRVDIRSIPLE